MSKAGTIRVLHVDDEPAFADLVATFLQREHDRITVRTATSPSEGLQQLADGDVDCIVSDYDMPDMNGIEFLHAVREEHPDLPFILYTGKGSEEIASEAISAGVTDYLQKESGSGQYTVLANRIHNAVDQHRSRQAVEETERKLSELAERTDDVLFMFSGDWSELLFINSAYEDVLGESVDALEEDPTSFLDLVHPEDRQKARASMERLSEGEPTRLEYRVVRPDGEPRWVRGETKAIQDEDGDVVRIVGLVRDITADKDRELHLETIIDNLPGYVYRHEYDSAYSLQFVKGDAELVTGYTATELEEQVVQAEEIIHPADRADLWSHHLEGLETTGRFDSTYRIITKSGDVRWIRDQGQLVEDPVTGEEVIDGFITDVSDTVRRKQAIRSQQTFIDENLDALRDVFYAVDTTGTLLRWNERVSAISGYTDEELDGMDATALFAEAHRERVREAITEAMETGSSFVQADILTADGKRQSFEFRGTRLTDPLRGDTVVVGIGRDISERVRREQELQRENERLEEFASIVSHDLRNPLTVARGRLELAREEHDSAHLEDVAQAHDRMTTLIEDLLELTRQGNQIDDTESVPLTDLVESCWETVETSDATLQNTVERSIRADRSRLAQLLENLIRNAVEHGGPDVTVSVGSLDGGFYVEDDGPGIPDDDREDVFTAGYTTGEQGTGFGLSIVEKVADAHGWHVRVSEGTDGGARFEVTGVEFTE